ncbi:MAG: SDR family oxidoreductase [Actinobacteria bacterium]|nr:SDR family oxidoreductase [Actinomycetota bacterium]
MELEGRVALVTGAGATGGIGFEIARALRREGARVLISGRDAERGEATCRALGGGTRFLLANLADVGQVRRLAEEAGEVDVLVNNAAGISFWPTAEQPLDEYEMVFATNVRAPYFLTSALAPGMVARGGGSIVNLSTVAAGLGTPGVSVYAASKAALESLTRTWAAEYGPHGVRVNTVAPGPIESEKVLILMGETIEEVGRESPLGRVGRTAEVAETVAFLACPRAGYVSGACIPVDGGRSAV